MQNISSLINNNIVLETVSFFFVEVVLFVVLTLNLILTLFFKNKYKAKKLSDYITASAFLFNLVGLFVMYFTNPINQNFLLGKNVFYFNNFLIFEQFVLNFFLLLYMCVAYKTTRVFEYKTTFLNSILSFIGFCSCTLVLVNNIFISLIFIDLVLFSMYEYFSCMRARKITVYSKYFLLINILASIVVYVFYLLSKTSDLQYLNMLFGVVFFIGYFLKIGIFPVVNYLTIKQIKYNLSISFLLVLYFSLISLIGLDKIIHNYLNISDIFYFAVLSFLILCMVNFFITALKTKNIIKFVSCVNYLYLILATSAFVVSGELKTVLLYTVALTMIQCMFCSLLYIVKINNKNIKFSVKNFSGLFLNNRKFAFMFSLALLLLFAVIPEYFSIQLLSLFKTIYSFDIIGSFLCSLFIALFVLVLGRAIGIIINIYNYSDKPFLNAFNKKTTINYVVFWLCFLSLIVLYIINFLL